MPSQVRKAKLYPTAAVGNLNEQHYRISQLCFERFGDGKEMVCRLYRAPARETGGGAFSCPGNREFSSAIQEAAAMERRIKRDTATSIVLKLYLCADWLRWTLASAGNSRCGIY